MTEQQFALLVEGILTHSHTSVTFLNEAAALSVKRRTISIAKQMKRSKKRKLE